MKCKDCKHCAYVNDGSVGSFTQKDSDGKKFYQVERKGMYCMLVNMTIIDVQECTAYDKRNLKLKTS